jgi:hypothetical protein
MFMNPAGHFDGSAQASKAPWSASTCTRRPVILPSLVAAIFRRHVIVAGKDVVERFSIRSSTHLTGTPVTMEPTMEQT